MDIHSVPTIARGCRLHATEPLLLIPEGTLQLSGPARDILALSDGQRTVASIVEHLLAQYSGADRAQMEQDVLGLLERLEQRGVVKGS